jgi:hypothetical protein
MGQLTNTDLTQITTKAILRIEELEVYTISICCGGRKRAKFSSSVKANPKPPKINQESST